MSNGERAHQLRQDPKMTISTTKRDQFRTQGRLPYTPFTMLVICKRVRVYSRSVGNSHLDCSSKAVQERCVNLGGLYKNDPIISSDGLFIPVCSLPPTCLILIRYNLDGRAKTDAIVLRAGRTQPQIRLESTPQSKHAQAFVLGHACGPKEVSKHNIQL